MATATRRSFRLLALALLLLAAARAATESDALAAAAVDEGDEDEEEEEEERLFVLPLSDDNFDSVVDAGCGEACPNLTVSRVDRWIRCAAERRTLLAVDEQAVSVQVRDRSELVLRKDLLEFHRHRDGALDLHSTGHKGHLTVEVAVDHRHVVVTLHDKGGGGFLSGTLVH